MKKFISLTILFLALFLVSVPLIAQETVPGIQIPDLNSLFTSFTGFCAGVIVLTGLLSKWLSLNTNGRSIISWVIALAVGLLGWWLQLGIFNGADFIKVLETVFAFAVGSNVVYNVPWLRTLLAKLKLAHPKSQALKK